MTTTLPDHFKIRTLRIRNYRGIEELEQDIPDKGALIAGGNGKGKTSAINAIRACLLASDVGPDAIRLGADKAEIQIDTDHFTVKRLISQRSQSVTVKNEDGLELKSPQTWLKSLLGDAPLDPITLMSKNKKERRAEILGALPVKVTPKHVEAWVPEWARPLVAGVKLDGHGLTVCDALRQAVYDQRALANKDAKATEEKVRAAEAALKEARVGLPEETPPLEAATAAEVKARSTLERMRAEQATYDKNAAAIANMKERVTSLREQSKELAAEADLIAPEPEVLERALATRDEAAVAVDKARRALREAEDLLELRDSEYRKLQDAADTAALKRDSSTARSQSADTLEKDLAALTAEPISPESLAAAEQALADASRAVVHATKGAAAQALKLQLDAARKEAKEAETRAGKLTNVVDYLANHAPTELIKEANAIEGLRVTTDEIYLDGVNLDGLCGEEQLTFCVEIARRANARSKLLIVDGLERVDSDLLPKFLQLATAGGYQLLATRVTRGDVVIEAIGQEGV